MERFDMRSPSAFRMTAEAPAERVTAFLQKVYGWMFIGLAVTAVVAFMVAGSPTLLRHIFSNQFLFFGLIVAELGLVFYLSARVETLAPTTAMTLFIVYSALNGVTLSFILLVYTGESIASTFLVTSGMFGALALWLDHQAQPRRRRSIPLHGPDRPGIGVDRRHVLAQRYPAVPDLHHRCDRVHGVDGVGCAAFETDGGDGA